MKNTKLKYLYIWLLLGMVSNVFGQALGDFVFTNGTADGKWGTASNWSISNGSGGYSGTAASVPTTSNNVWIPSGKTVLITSLTPGTGGSGKVFAKDLHIAGTLNCRANTSDWASENSNFLGNVYIESTGTVNDAMKWILGNGSSTDNRTIEIASGGKLYFQSASRLFVCGTSGSVTINNAGTFGAAAWAANAGALITMGGSFNGNVTFKMSGNGNYVINKIASDNYAPNSRIIVDANISLTANSGAAVILIKNSNLSNTSHRYFTVNEGKTLTLNSGSWFNYNTTSTSRDANNTYIINGTLDCSAASIYFGSPNNSQADSTGVNNRLEMKIGSKGILKCGSVIKVEKFYASQILNVEVSIGGKITYPAGVWSSFPVTGTIATGTSSVLLTNNNSDLLFTGSNSTSIALNSDFNVQNIEVPSSFTLTQAGNFSLSGTLSAGGKVTCNSGSFIVNENAILNLNLPVNYIDLSAGGSFIRKKVPANSTIFPIGTGSSYSPLTFVNTSNLPDITTKVSSTFSNAVEDASKVVNIQWYVSSNTASSSDISFQFNGVNKAVSFDASTECELGGYTDVWTSANAGIPTGSDPYLVSVSGVNIPTVSNIFIVGNSGSVVRTSATNTVWTGAVSSDWNVAGNWSNGIPNSTLDAEIPSSLLIYPIITITDTVKNLTLASGASLINNGVLKITGKIININGTLSGSGEYVLSGTEPQKITGNFTVNYLTVQNNSGIINNGILGVSSYLKLIAGSMTGTAPVFAENMPVTFSGSGALSAGLALTPASGNIGKLDVNGTGTLTLTAPVTVKSLLLTNGTLNNSNNNITVTDSVIRYMAGLTASPIYNGSIPVFIKSAANVSSTFELNPSTGSIGKLTVSPTAVFTVGSTLTVAGDIEVLTGTMNMNANVFAQNVLIASGAVLTTANNSGSSTGKSYLVLGSSVVDGDAVLNVNGLLGGRTRWTADGIDIQISANAKSLSIEGDNATGYVGVSGLRPVADANSRPLNVYINRSMRFGRDQGGSGNIEPALTLQNGTCIYPRTLTITSGDTVFIRGNAGLHGMKNTSSKDDELINNYASTSANQANCTYIVQGVLDLVSEGYSTGSSNINLNTCSYSGNNQSVTIQVKNGGLLKLPGIVKMYTSNMNQTADIITENGSLVDFAFNGTQTNLLTGANLPRFSFKNIKISNTNGINLNAPMFVQGTLELAGGNVSGSAIALNGTSVQNIISNGSSIANLTINNIAGIMGSPVVTNNLTLSNGSLSDFSNLVNATVVFNGSTTQTIGTGLSAVKNLTVNNMAGVTLNSDPTLSGTLTFQNGKLNLGDHNLTMGTNAVISSAGQEKYIVTNGTGMLVMNAAASASTVFPVGTVETFNPVTIQPEKTAIFYVGVNNSINPLLPTNEPSVLPLKTINRTWKLTTSNPSSTNLTFGYSGDADNNSGFDNTGTEVSLLQFNGNQWQFVGSGAVIPGVGVSTPKTATIDGIGSFSSFTIANPGPGAIYTNTSGSTFSDIFRSSSNGLWSSSSLWELYDNATSAWQPTALSPTETSTVTIQANDTVIISTAAGVGNLTIENGAVLKSAVSAYTSNPIELTIGKTSSMIRNNGQFGCASGSPAGTLGDGISMAIGSNCVSFQITGTGYSNIGSLYAFAGSNNLNILIDQDIDFRYSTSGSKKTALTLLDPNSSGFSGSRNLHISAGKKVSFMNSNSCLHSNVFSTSGSNSELQGNISYDIQGILDLKGGNVYMGSSSNLQDSTQTVKVNVGKSGKIIVSGDFNFTKVQKKQSVYLNLEDGALIDASESATSKSSFYGPTISSSGDSLYVWIITNGNSYYKRLCGTGSTTRYFNVAVAPADGDYANMKGNPLSVSTNSGSLTDIYTVNVNAGHPYPLTSFDPAYAINRTWTIIPSRIENPYGTYVDFGYTGTSSTDANSIFSPTLSAVSGSSRYTVNTEETVSPTSVPAGSTDLYAYIGESGSWYCLFPVSYNVPVAGGTLGSKYKLRYNSMYSSIGNFCAPYKFTLRNSAAPLICP